MDIVLVVAFGVVGGMAFFLLIIEWVGRDRQGGPRPPILRYRK